MRPLSIGLRAQLILALSIAFIAAFTLLGIATVQLTQRARSLDRYHEVKESCERLANELAGAREGANLRFETLSAALIGRNGVTGLEWNRPAGELRAGAMAPEFVRTERANGDTFTMWYRAPLATDATPVTNLLLLYVATTGGAILLITYVWLTYLIVRPLEAVTRAAGRLARGNPFAAVPERGAAEVVALASSFNDMATQLRHEQERMRQHGAALEQT
ncbi:MAG: HAMP domain-containing protein, partial [Myxococcales bacterium]|nr:HAMP domain-containing protein [Myxococcales bacterium]